MMHEDVPAHIIAAFKEFDELHGGFTTAFKKLLEANTEVPAEPVEKPAVVPPKAKKSPRTPGPVARTPKAHEAAIEGETVNAKTPTGVMSLRKTSRGRLLKPSLEWWKNEVRLLN
jgi:hypothetical protein